MMANLLFFITGSFKLPFGGFKRFKISLNKTNTNNKLPVAHTCS